MKYTCINIQGNLISEEILQKIEKGEAQGQSTTDFGFEPGANIRSEIEYAWSRIKLDWKHYSSRNQNLPQTDQYGTTLSRKWMEQFFSSIGFELAYQKTSLQGDNNQTYNISHKAENVDQLPIHIVGFIEPNHPDKNTLDVKTSGGTSRFSPHGTMQEYLNVTEHLYGIATNGLFLRLIRDSGRLIKLTYVEFDIKRMLDEDKYSEFTLLYRLIHASRFPHSIAEADQCLLERYYQDSIETGNRIRDGLSLAVKESLVALGKGFLQHENNTELRDKIQTGKLFPKDYYRQLLRIIYRLLFLMVTEERDLVYDPDDKNEALQKLKKIYFQFYSIHRLRKLSENRYIYEAQFTDLWQGLVNTFQLFEAGSNGKKLGIQPLDGDLFNYNAITDLQNSLINNKLLLECIRNLNEFTDDKRNLVPINYRSLDVEELGSVYEGLLELHPVIEGLPLLSGENQSEVNPAQINFTFHEGTERKTTGSYYTRPELVNELIKSALIPVIEERLKEHSGNKDAQAKTLLKLKVCDAAAGSGHMMLAAARTIAWYLARVQSGEENPAPSLYRSCLREVIQHCIYAVDLNPDAVELCKLALWLEGHNSGKPLSFLDHKIRNGNSLVGVTDLSVLKKGIPDDAFNAVTGDDKDVCKDLKKINAQYNKTKQRTIDFYDAVSVEAHSFSADYNQLEDIKQDDVESVQQVKTKFEQLRRNRAWYKDWNACNIWTSAFFFNYTPESKQAAPSSERLASYLLNPGATYGPMVGEATDLSLNHKFFHWPLEFPDVFEQGGFDVILGNPPWEIVELSEKEFFSNLNQEIVIADTSSDRKQLIGELKTNDPNLFKLFIQKKHYTDSQRKFIQSSNRFPDSSIGRIDLYPLFFENSNTILSKKGICALILPSSIAMGAYNADLFSKFVNEDKLKSFFDFENSKGLFPDVHRSYRICLITFTGGEIKNKSIQLLYFGKQVSDLLNENKRITLSKDDLEMFSPNTLAPPIILTNFDLQLAKKIYLKFGVLTNKKKHINDWQVYIKRMLSLSDGENIFRKSYELEKTNELHNKSWIKLYSGKAIYQYDHRYAFYKNRKWENSIEAEYRDSSFSIITEYYAKHDEVLKRTNSIMPNSYLLGFRDTARSTDERTCIASIVPRVGCDSHCRNIYFLNTSNSLIIAFLCNMNSLVFDYFVRQKVIGTGLGSGTFEQLPLLPPSEFADIPLKKIVSISIELVYTSWDIKAFADDVWKEADEDLKESIQKQWEANNAATGGHEWSPPEWSDEHGHSQNETEGCPLPPFKWDEGRRAVLKAELDAIYAKLYGFTTEELRYILDPQDVYGSDFPGETFRVLKEKEKRLYGEYRTRRLVLEAWERLENGKNETPFIFSDEKLSKFKESTSNSSTMKEFGLNEGIYSVSDVVRMTRLSAEKVKRWFIELSKENYEGLTNNQKNDIESMRISFHGLIELVVIGTLRENEFSLKKILKARTDLNSKTNKIYPFATNDVKMNLKVIPGKGIYFNFPEGLVKLDGTGQYNLDIIYEFFANIEFDIDGIALRLFPLSNSKLIVIDPKLGGGKPAITGKGIYVEMIQRAHSGNTSMESIMDQFDLNMDEINAALEYSLV